VLEREALALLEAHREGNCDEEGETDPVGDGEPAGVGALDAVTQGVTKVPVARAVADIVAEENGLG
jgi:hypothetical protein